MVERIGSPAVAPPDGQRERDRPAKVEDAARQFEALLLGQLLKSMRDSSTGWLSSGDDQAGTVATQMAEEQLGQALASQGGLGLARLVVSGLQAKKR